jgi:citrate lyase subunit beta/citryl-CoA lyase
MRTLLYVPGNKPNMIRKAPNFGADILVLDLEDAVPAAEKAAAREIVASILNAGDLKHHKVMVRINSLESQEYHLDLAAVVVPGLIGLRIPKVESPEQIRTLDNDVTALERQRGLKEGSIVVMPILESPVGVLRAYDIATASPRIIALTLGAEDLTASMGTQRTRDGMELQHARGHVVLCAAAAKVGAIDTVFPNIIDEEGLVKETLHIKQMGFTGKSAIHPKQIAPIHAAFAPTEEDVANARKIVNAFKAAEADGSGAITVDGRMVDLPVVIRARRILALAGEQL